MVKEWRCTQCENMEKRTIRERISDGPPEECSVCDNDEFEEGISAGLPHKILDTVT